MSIYDQIKSGLREFRKLMNVEPELEQFAVCWQRNDDHSLYGRSELMSWVEAFNLEKDPNRNRDNTYFLVSEASLDRKMAELERQATSPVPGKGPRMG